ncbi:MAG TPA: murein L,D-transpeptidase [Thiotrichaceae bacterium]|jgi:murein L,D-transpeptidase YafK|nr:murein L,D-transpeptidase [Thiotrichaceae bacterium]HIM07977.1 murein L,D-transpeptidase [Gammaproteobacteria bacterium]
MIFGSELLIIFKLRIFPILKESLRIMYMRSNLNSFFLMFLLFCIPLAQASEYQILISKKNNELIVKKAGEVVKKYRISSGKGGKGTKRRQGDSKTPQGVYRISQFKKSSRFHYFIQLDYPNLIDAWYGYKNKVIDAKDFKRIATAYKKHTAPPQDTKLGGFIGIHGLGEQNEKKIVIHEEINWTEGCIALTNEEINELRKFVDIGTPVIIKE